MKSRSSLVALLAVSLLTRSFARDEPTPPPTPTPVPEAPAKTNMKEELRAQPEADAKKQAAAKPTRSPFGSGKITAAPSQSTSASTATGPATKAASPSPSAAPTATDSAANAKDNSVTMMPKVEVRRERITEVDRAVHAKDLEIAKETEKTQATETDKTLNNSKISGGFMSIFGGRSAEVGEGLASERVRLLEIERDLVAEIALAKTKEEKADLQKQLDEIKAMRRDLDKPR